METSIPLNATSTCASSRKHRIRARGGLGLRVSTAEKPSKLDLAPAALGDEPQERRRSADALDMKMISYVVVTLAALLIVACGGAGGVTSSVDRESSKRSAGQVIKQLQDAGVPIDASQELTAANDPNELLGRPGQYTGKAFFHDARLPAEKNSLHPELIDSESGGSVEVFASEADAKERADYVRAFTESSGMFAEYSYVRGAAFIRVTGKLTPDQAEVYERAAASL
jgi:hypothetical protein